MSDVIRVDLLALQSAKRTLYPQKQMETISPRNCSKLQILYDIFNKKRKKS